MWRFLVPAVFAVPLLWTVVAEWRLVVDGPPPSDLRRDKPPKCDNPVDRAAAHEGYGEWAAIALRIDKKTSKKDFNHLKSPWKELCDNTKARVESLGEARQFADRYRKGEDAENDSAMRKNALEQRKVDVELLRVRGSKWKRVKDDEELKKYRSKLGEPKSDINDKARAELREWVEMNEVLNKSTKEDRLQLIATALAYVKDCPKCPPFAPESEEKIDSMVAQLTTFENQSNTALRGLLSTVGDAKSAWEDLQRLKREVNKYEKLSEKIRAVAEIAEQVLKDEETIDVKLAREAAQALCDSYLPRPVKSTIPSDTAERDKQAREYLVGSAKWTLERLEKLKEIPHLYDVVDVLLAKPGVFLPQ